MKKTGTFIAGIALAACLLGGGITMATHKTAAAASGDPPWGTAADLIFVDENSDAKYQKNRVFLCSGGIEVTGDRLWSITFSGGTTEPHEDNYVALTYSDDMGKSWRDPYIAIDNLTYPDETRLFEPQLWRDPAGKLWIFYTQTGGKNDPWGASAGNNYRQACFAYVLENPAADPADFRFTDMGLLIKYGRIFSKPIVVDNNGTQEWLVSSHEHATQYTDCYSSVDGGKTWTKKGSAKGENCGAHEAWIAQLSDGALMMTKRIDNGVNGGVEISFSYDLGTTWSNYAGNQPEPFVAPGSRMNLYKLASGNLLFISNHHATDRTNLTVFLSEDDGMTWKYSLLLDDRDDPATSWVDQVSYPDVTQAPDGTIYVAWDYQRTGRAETRFSSFTEQDIKNGAFSKDCIYKRPIFKNNNQYRDIMRFERFGGIPQMFGFGTSKEDIASSQLSEMTIYLSDGSEYDVTGSWDSADFVPNKAGEYTFTFTPDSLPARVEDVQNVLTVYITVLEESEIAVTQLEITPPAKTQYALGEELDLAGLVVKAKLQDGGKRTLSASEYTVTGYDKDKAGEQTVTVTYEGVSATFKVTVGGTEDGKKGGCGSTIGAASAAAGGIALLGATIMIRRKKDENDRK